MKRICLWGTSLKKVADEAQLLAVCQAIRSRIPDAEITIFAQQEGSFEQRHPGIEAIRTAHLGSVLSRLARADLFIVVGGPFMESPSQAVCCLALSCIAKIFRRPMITYGTTVLGYKTRWGRVMFKHLLKRMDAITVREEVGLKVLRDLSVNKEMSLVADPRFLLEPAPPNEARKILIQEGLDPDMPMIGITTRHLHEQVPKWVKRSHQYSADNVKNANAVIGRTVDDLGRFAQLVLIPMHPSYDDDVRTAVAIKHEMHDPSRLKVLSRSYRTPELLGIINACDMLIAGRLGSAIFATITATPLVAIAYESRMIDHMQKFGYGHYVRDWTTLDCDDFPKIAKEVWSSRQTVKDHMRSQIQILKEQAWRNTEMIRMFIGRRRAVTS